jgi:uncharacterized protein (DUF362 family)
MRYRSLEDPRVAAVRLGSYAGDVGGAVWQIADMLGWNAGEDSPFGAVIPDGARVLIKPNWVTHRNQGSGGFEPLVTHGSVVRAVTEAALRSGASSVIVGDAPLQTCDFEALLEQSGLRRWAAELQSGDPRFRGLHDFRRTVSTVAGGVRRAREEQQPLDRFVLFDLGAESLLEPVTRPGVFRVTQYDPSLMERTHAPGRHQYLVSRDVMEADVVLNLPKLKTHKKAGITCALKNLIGINGNKEFLPHHRVGGADDGGDCYPGRSRTKRLLEWTLDRLNQTSLAPAAATLNRTAEALDALARRHGDELGVEGSWSGNDTIWRTCLDLNRILLYGTPAATMADTPRRAVLHIVDAVVGGQGDGPLSPDPLPLGMLLGSASGAAMDHVGAILLRYDPAAIPISREAFGRFTWPLTLFTFEAVRLTSALKEGTSSDLTGTEHPASVVHPSGWREAAAAANPVT